MTLLTDAPAAPVTAAEDVPVLVVEGDLGLASLARTRERLEDLLAHRPGRLVVDLARCTFVDASALAMLLEAHRRMARTGGVLTLQGCSPRVLRLLSLTGLRRVFDLAAPDRAGAGAA